MRGHPQRRLEMSCGATPGRWQEWRRAASCPARTVFMPIS